MSEIIKEKVGTREIDRSHLTYRFDKFEITSPEKGVLGIYLEGNLVAFIDNCTASDDVVRSFKKRIESLQTKLEKMTELARDIALFHKDHGQEHKITSILKE